MASFAYLDRYHGEMLPCMTAEFLEIEHRPEMVLSNSSVELNAVIDNNR